MNVRKTVKKILALGAGVTMVGATIMGAMAYDLANYPAPFIQNGVFSGKIVVGEKAATQDVLGAIDIAASLQAQAVSKEAVEIPGAAGQVSLEGDSFKLATGADALELREPVGDVVDTISESNLAGLKGGHISTSEGDTDYQQYIRLKDGTNLQSMAVNYIANDDNVMGDYLVVDVSKPFIEWEIQFGSGFESELSTARLTDLEDETFNIMGQDFSVVTASLTGSSPYTGIEMTLMGGSSPATLREGETKTFTIDGVEYEVTLVFVSDPSTSGATPEAKFMVNGEVTKALSESDTATLSGGLQIGVRDILVNSRDGVASFYLGADKIVFTDANFSDSDFSNAGSVEINQDSISDGDVEIAGAYTTSGNTKFEITSIKYRLTMNGDVSSIAYVPAGHGVKELMRYPRSLISDSLDLKYMGLEEVTTKDLKVKARGDDRYQIEFTNIEGATYTFPFVSYQDGTWKFGDNNYDLIFVEGANVSDYKIGRNDYFIVSNYRSEPDKSVTNVLRYRSYDTVTKTLDFEDLATSSIKKVVVDSTGVGSLVIGGHTYAVKVNSTTINEPAISVDLDASGNYDDMVYVTSWGGAYLNLALAVDMDGNTSNDLNTVPELQTIVGNGLTIEDGANWDESAARTISMQLTVPSTRFDSSTTDETFNWTVSNVLTGQQVDLTTTQTLYAGPNEGASEWDKFTLDNKDDDNSEHKVGMTDYGIFVDHYNPSGSNDPDELTFQIPEIQRYAQVFVTMGSVTASEGGAGVTTEVVNPIAVGLAVLDSDAEGEYGVSNLIVVGGPCANTVAAELMGNQVPCSTGFVAGKALIKSWEKDGKVAILVAGYEAQETLGASYVLANYGDYEAYLKGSEVEVVVADLNDLTVQAVTAMAEEPAMEETPVDETA